MRALTLAFLVLVLAACGPATGRFVPGPFLPDQIGKGSHDGFRDTPVNRPVEPPIGQPGNGDDNGGPGNGSDPGDDNGDPGNGDPGDDNGNGDPGNGNGDPGDDEMICRIIHLPPTSAVERIEKCPGERADLHWRRGRP